MGQPDSIANDFVDRSQEAAQGPVLFLMNALGVGGSERKTVSIVNELHRTNFKVQVAYLDNRTPLLRHVSSGISSTFLNRKGKLSLSAIAALRTCIRKEQFTKIVCVSLYPLIYAVAAVITLPRRHRPPVALMINATEITERRVRRQMILYRPLMRMAQRIVFGCHMQMELWCNRYGLDARNCRVIYNGIDEKRFSRASAGQRAGPLAVPAGIEKEDFLIGAVGTLWPNKNHAELVAMLKAVRPVVPNAKLLIAGEGPERQRLLDAAEEAGVSDNVYLLGEVDDVRPILERVDVFVLPSISETFSNAVLEAMAMEKVVIVSDTGGMREMVTDEVDGYVYEQGDVAGLCALVERLAADPERRVEIGRKARKTVEKRFTFDRMIDEYVKLLA